MEGKRLREARERRGLSIDEVAAGARVPRKYLIAMEDEDAEALPAAPFLRSYWRQVLAYLGEDPGSWNASAPASSAPHALPVPGSGDAAGYEPTATIPKADELPVTRLVVLGFFLTLATVLGLRLGSQVVTGDAAESEALVLEESERPQTVRVRAVESTRVMVETDSSYHHNGTLDAGQTVAVESLLPITVEVSDLTRVSIHHNGRRIEPLHNLSHPRRLVFVPE